jgi:hypothetical protein
MRYATPSAQPGNHFLVSLYLLSMVKQRDEGGIGGTFLKLFRLAADGLEATGIEDPSWHSGLYLLNFVLCDEEARQIVIRANLNWQDNKLAFQSMTMGDLETIRTFEVNEADQRFYAAHFLSSTLPMSLLTFHFFQMPVGGERTKETVRALNTKADVWVDAPPALYSHVRIAGGEHWYEDNFLQTVGLTMAGQGQLSTWMLPYEAQVGPPLPPSMQFSQSQSPRMVLNNSQFTAVLDWTVRASSQAVVYRILEKRTNTWRLLTVPGGFSFNVRAFGPWMGGMIDRSVQGSFRLSPVRHIPPRLPGRRLRYADKFEGIDDYLENNEIYRDGSLFLYNVGTHRYYHWETRNGDCEILLVDGDRVYYRADQKLYRAKIGDLS